MATQIINADVLDGLAQLEDESVQCCVTSPPYWNLRDYGVPGQIGMEPTPEAFVAKMVEVFRGVRRVLRKDGVLFMNLGDSYASQGGKTDGTALTRDRELAHMNGAQSRARFQGGGIKPKDLVGVPWMTAFALRADGWWLRQEIIWNKPNPMPESVRDRCTKSHEHIFLLTKSERYFFDAGAIAEASLRAGEAPGGNRSVDASRNDAARDMDKLVADMRNKRSVWSIATAPFAEAHFATFPEELPEICIKAGSRLGDTVLDPFGGAGTTGLVADKLGRNAVLIELNPEYAAMAEKRIIGNCPMFASVSASPLRSSEEPQSGDTELPLDEGPPDTKTARELVEAIATGRAA